jgi:hypothetical protein
VAIRISTAARNAAADAVAALVDGGDNAGLLRIYSGSQPAGPGTAITDQDLLAEFTLNDPAFGSASNGSAALDVDPAITTTGEDDGTATWFRIVDSDEAGIIDGSVTASGGGGDLTLNTVTISVGVDVSITSGSITMPAS